MRNGGNTGPPLITVCKRGLNTRALFILAIAVFIPLNLVFVPLNFLKGSSTRLFSCLCQEGNLKNNWQPQENEQVKDEPIWHTFLLNQLK